MSKINRLRIAAVGLAALLLSACGINSVPTAEENAKARWADVQNAYDRRAQALPNLAEVAKSASEREGQILTDVIEARAKATSIQVSDADLSDPAKLQQYAAAQGQLSAGLGRLLASVEAYPQLQSVINFQMLQSQVEGSENRINIAIKDYNEAVREYNTTIRTFPDIIGAKLIHGAEPMATFTAVTPNAEQAPDLGSVL
ncbi:LemA family protein [Croceicoccus mobilis]|uniref:LemA protein n=1 Tax=Croceicoccus mobilis TaxID=1703339 RepID=A0A916Z6W1_9SPHN|nr:LemA family protein [Croceicoccus mobilis]GGD77878.1 LemA protein [Croceicoccus mobilis]